GVRHAGPGWPKRPPGACIGLALRGLGRLTRPEADKQAAVVVVRGEDVGRDGLPATRPRPYLEVLAEAAHAPLEGEGDRVLAVLVTRDVEPLDDVVAHQLLLGPARQLEDAAARSKDPAARVAHDEARVRARVVVLH